MDDDIPNHNLSIRRKRSGLGIPELYEPCRDGWRGKNRYLAREEPERPERKMVRVRVSYEDRAERWEIGQCNSGLANPRKKPS